MKYIHYGHESFDIAKFDQISNNLFFATKPIGGLWACQCKSEDNWKNWCIKNQDKEVELNKYFIFSLREDSRILTIDNCDKLKDLPKTNFGKDVIKRKVCTELDFEQLSKEYDAIEVFISKDDNLYFELYGWDCDSILIMNPDIIIPEIENELFLESEM